MIIKKLYLFNRNKKMWMKRVENEPCSILCSLYHMPGCAPSACLHMLGVLNVSRIKHYRYIPDVNKKIYNT